MRNTRPVHVRNKSTEPGTPSSPMMTSPLMHRHTRSGSNAGPASSAKKAQTKAAAQRLAAVMSNQTGDEEDSDEDLSFDYNASGTGSIGLAAGRSHPSRSPVIRNPIARRSEVAAPQLADEDNEDDDFSVDVSSTRPSIGLPGGRAMRPHSPVMTKIAPPRRTPPANEDNKNDEDDDVVSVDYTIGRPSIGLGSGRAMRPQSSMTKTQPQGRPVMAIHQPADDDNEDDDTPYVYTSGIPSVGLASGRAARSRSPLTKTPPLRHPQSLAQPPTNGDSDADYDESYTSGMPSIGLAGGRSMRPRTPLSIRTKEQPQTGLPTSGSRSSLFEDSTEPSAISTLTSHPSQTTNQVEQSASARSLISNKSSQSLSATDQPPSARSSFSGRPIRTVPLMPSSVPISLKPVTPAFQSDTPTNLRKDKRLSMDLGSSGNLRELGSQRSTSALQDEVDMLQEENESLLEKLRLAEDKCDEADARAKQLEKQVEILGEGVTMDARLLSRKEAALQQREAALRVASQNHGGRREDVSALHTEAEIAREEAASSLEQLHEVELELNSLKTVTKRLILTQEEMEEVVLKRCWLSRYWGLCVRHGIQADIAGAKHEYWSSFAPLPLEIVLSAGQRARDGVSQSNTTKGEREKSLESLQETSGEGNVESMIWVEKGLRELASLKVQEAVAFVMAQNRRSSSSKFFVSDEVKLPMDGQFEAFVWFSQSELSDEEVEDVSFKQAWLSYFWRRAKNHDIESDIADERLQCWINQGTRSATSQDAVDVERGLVELRKLNIESQLWQKSRKGLDHESNPSHLELSF
ncbi:coiled-coil domain-containing protein SCD2 isoform X2 [Capsella rubella]|uniref:coiled-coil domain-containing protein SCD2 isoform X2 n=1 Tax=Capsella rubella TaxID=81985 RepID=UPI000CD512A8|nr:coiled-coil domain-containing protein SCD2 isoform X2 [Capsella rubella]